MIINKIEKTRLIRLRKQDWEERLKGLKKQDWIDWEDKIDRIEKNQWTIIKMVTQ